MSWREPARAIAFDDLNWARSGLIRLVVFLVAASFAHAEEPRMPAGVIQLDETVISGNQELPKVLYILPWREPDGLPDIELEMEFIETDVFRRLYPPAYRRELSYFKTLDETE